MSRSNENPIDEIFPDQEIKKYNFNIEEAKRLLQVVFDFAYKDKALKI